MKRQVEDNRRTPLGKDKEHGATNGQYMQHISELKRTRLRCGLQEPYSNRQLVSGKTPRNIPRNRIHQMQRSPARKLVREKKLLRIHLEWNEWDQRGRGTLQK